MEEEKLLNKYLITEAEKEINKSIFPCLLRLNDVCKLIGLSKASIWNKLNPDSKYYDPSFPKQLRISKKAVAWDRNEIIEWINNLKQQN